MSGLAFVLASGEVSKTPFYAAGALLSIWAVVVSGVGLSRPRFPDSQAGSVAVMGVTGLLVAAVMVTAVTTASKPTKEKGERATSQSEAEGSSRPEGQLGGTSGGPEIEKEGAQAQAPGGAQALRLSADSSGELAYTETSLSSPAGAVTLQLTNPSRVPHNVRLEQDGRELGGTKTITSGRTSARVRLQPGRYTFYCSVDGHRQGGMQGTLNVR